MLTRIWVIAVVLTMAPSLLRSSDLPKEFDLVKASITPILANLNPKSELSYSVESEVIFVRYRVLPYQVHRTFKSAGRSEETHEEIGPDYKGFILRINFQNKGEPQELGFRTTTLENEFWKTEVEFTSVYGTSKKMQWNLSYGAGTDMKLLAELRAALRNLGKNGSNKTIEPMR